MSVITAAKRALSIRIGISEVPRSALPEWLHENTDTSTETLLREYQRIHTGLVELEATRKAAQAADEHALDEKIRERFERGLPVEPPVRDSNRGPHVQAWIAKWGYGDALLDEGRAQLIAGELQRRYRAEGEPDGLKKLRGELRTTAETIASVEGERRQKCREHAIVRDTLSVAERDEFDSWHEDTLKQLSELRRALHERKRGIYDSFGAVR